MLRQQEGAETSTAAITTAKSITPNILVKSYSQLVIHISNTSANALTNLIMEARFTPNGTWYTVLTGSDWGTIAGILRGVQGGLNTLAGGANGMAQIDLFPFHEIRFQATAGSAAETTVVHRMRE